MLTGRHLKSLSNKEYDAYVVVKKDGYYYIEVSKSCKICTKTPISESLFYRFIKEDIDVD